MLIVTPPCTLNYVFIDKPQEFDQGKPKYSVMILIDPEENLEFLKMLKIAFIDVAAKHFPSKKDVDIKFPLNFGGNTHPNDEYISTVFHLTARRNDRPKIVDANDNVLESPGGIYSGCVARVSFEILPYKVNGTYGLRCKLGAIQKISNGEKIGSSENATDDQFVEGLKSTPIDAYNAIETEQYVLPSQMSEDERAEYEERTAQLRAIQDNSIGGCLPSDEYDPDELPF
ncbi:MAG: hypothetical protein ATN35_12760 [Epulopiscium sp. Nele67-Bin004]|nr:MAG: hypothetical protein ATN35_12760 [Epulopiscium sp. Nele67-Bin004]